MFSNYHSHSTFCDGRGSMEDFVRFALSKGIVKYGFSSHAPLPFHTQWTMNEDDYPDYEKEFLRLKEKYAGQIELYLGLEVDYIHHCSDIRNDFFKHTHLDYVIGSIHYLDKLAEHEFWSIDGAFDAFDRGLHQLFDGDIRQAARRFFEVSSFMIETGGIDIVGHADKITLHGMKYSDFDVAANWFVQLVSEYFELIKRKNLILEINTKSFREKGLTFPHPSFFQLIRELDIPIHVNSDCHYPTNVTDGFDATYRLLYQAGFRSVQQLYPDGWRAVEFDEQGIRF